MSAALGSPFRADHVGSLLRPAALRDARARHDSGSLAAAELRAIEDRCIGDLVRQQEEIGLLGATDGELRRGYWHYDFLAGLKGIELQKLQPSQSGSAGFVHRHRLQISGRIGWQAHPFVEDFRFLASRTLRARAKQTIPSPSVVHFRFGAAAIASGAYKSVDVLLDDLAATYSAALADFAAAGCRYLQLDEVNLAMLCDPEQVRQAQQRGVFREDLPAVYADLINGIVRRRPPDMLVSLHLCRGNFQSTWIASGGYEPVAELLFGAIDVDAYFVEYDSARAGGFEPLRFLSKGKKMVILGLVTSKSGALESKDDLKRRIDEAARFVPLEQLALSPQCGFASTEEGNSLTQEQQWSKLRLCLEVAEEVWGRRDGD